MWWSTPLRVLTLPVVSSPVFRRLFCWLPAATWPRCGVRPACSSIWERPGSRERVRLVLNRFRKVAGFSEADAEAAVGAKLLWRIPNQYFAISGAIDRGTPVMDQRNSEIARCFAGLAQELTRNDADVKRAAWSLFKSV